MSSPNEDNSLEGKDLSILSLPTIRVRLGFSPPIVRPGRSSITHYYIDKMTWTYSELPFSSIDTLDFLVLYPNGVVSHIIWFHPITYGWGSGVFLSDWWKGIWGTRKIWPYLNHVILVSLWVIHFDLRPKSDNLKIHSITFFFQFEMT